MTVASNLAGATRSRAANIMRRISAFVALASATFAALTFFGAWNSLRGVDVLSEAASRFDRSYSDDASAPVRRGDPAWGPLMRVITEYTRARLPTDKEPLVLARSHAISSVRTDTGEWTAPTTPLLLLYKEWPGHGDISKDDYRIVGTIQDLHDWIRQDIADFDFFWRNVIFGLFTACVGVYLALRAEKGTAQAASEPPTSGYAPLVGQEEPPPASAPPGTPPPRRKGEEDEANRIMNSNPDR